MKRIIIIFFISIGLFTSLGCGYTNGTESTLITSNDTQLSTNEVSSEIIVQTTTQVETTQDTIQKTLETNNYSFDDFLGEGTFEQPYIINMMIGDSFQKTINFQILSSHLNYEEGIFLGNQFYPLSEVDLLGLDLTGSNDFSLVINTKKIGVFYIRISSETANPSYIRVNVEEYRIDFSQNLKVLAIGNSFSVDAMEYLYKIALDYGIPNIVLGIMYIPGASLSKHVDSIENYKNDYVYLKNNNDGWLYEDSSSTLIDGLQDEDWDVITIQQVSGYSGVPTSYNEDIDTIINYILEHSTNNLARIAWHMTWAYEQESIHPDFIRYSSDQMTMYHEITSTVIDKITIRDDIEFVIPSGTAIQNLRTSFIGDTLTRDGYHLSMDIGRYTSGLTWFHKITEFSIDDIVYTPVGIEVDELLAIKEAVKNAIIYPFNITQSKL